jgi:hypothetical protein
MMTEKQLMHDLLDGLPEAEDAANAEAAATLVDVLPYLGRALGLRGLACLAGSSRQLRESCINFAESNARILLLDALPAVKTGGDLAEAAAAAAAEATRITPMITAELDERLQPVMWLLHVAPAVSSSSALTASDVLQRLLHLPHVPLQQAQQLLAAGVRIPYAQLLAAARSMVAGVEVWVQAQQQLGITSDIPAAAVAICCRQIWVSLQTVVSCQLPTYGT